jgi:hypothetical protein
MKRTTSAIVSSLACCGVMAAEPELPLHSPEIKAAVEQVIHQMAAMFTRLDGPQPITLFDPAERAPQYLGEEMPDWMIGWDKLSWYFKTPERFAVVEAMDYHPSNIRVRSLTPDLALATWDVFAEMKFKRGPPMGEKLRANAILRKTDAGWRFIYYAEAPKSTMTYIRDLYEEMARPEFRRRFDNAVGPVPSVPGSASE